MYHEKPSLETKQRRSSDVSAAELVSDVLPNQASCISAYKGSGLNRIETSLLLNTLPLHQLKLDNHARYV